MLLKSNLTGVCHTELKLLESPLNSTKRIRESGRSCTYRGWSQCVAGWSAPSAKSVRSLESGSKLGWTGTCTDFRFHHCALHYIALPLPVHIMCYCSHSMMVHFTHSDFKGLYRPWVCLCSSGHYSNPVELTVWGQPGWPPGHMHFHEPASPRSAPMLQGFLGCTCERQDLLSYILY